MRLALPAILWLSAAAVSAGIVREFPPAAFDFTLDNSLYRILGGAKEALGDTFFVKADEYYHGGADEKFHEESGLQIKAPQDWIARVNAQIRAHEDRHLSGEKKKEMLPFFALAVSLDPHNVQAILTTAYWLEKEYGKPDEALRVLEEGFENNPRSADIEAALGDFYFDRKKDAISLSYYKSALAKVEPLSDEDSHLLAMRIHSHLEKIQERSPVAA